MKSQSYMNRAMRSRDPRFAQILGKLGYEQPAPAKTPEDELADLRAQYKDATGKRAYHGWDAEALRAKIANPDGDDETDD